MQCYHPLTAYRQAGVKTGITFKKDQTVAQSELQLPCGQCWGCRLERARQWAMRCVHESKQHDENMFITLTYNDENLPQDNSLDKRHFQLFIKRYRNYLNREEQGQKIKYFQCGEYGEKKLRPHYHALIFGHDFKDKVLYNSENNTNLYYSNTLSRLWGFGFCSIGAVTFESAGYIARYNLKKITQSSKTPPEYIRHGKLKKYERVDPETGLVTWVEPEYLTMSRGGRTGKGIGNSWIEKWKSDVYPSDEVIVRGRPMRPPKYYDEQYQDIDLIKDRRIRKAKERRSDNTEERLAVKEKVNRAACRQLKRNLED